MAQFTYDNSGNVIQVNLDINEPIVYSSIMSFSLQTFNSTNVNLSDDNVYFNNLFFYNYIDPKYFIKSIRIFDYDYDKYFPDITLNDPIKKNPELHNIGSLYSDLYCQIIKNDPNITYPIIINLHMGYSFIPIDQIKLVKLIRLYC